MRKIFILNRDFEIEEVDSQGLENKNFILLKNDNESIEDFYDRSKLEIEKTKRKTFSAVESFSNFNEKDFSFLNFKMTISEENKNKEKIDKNKEKYANINLMSENEIIDILIVDGLNLKYVEKQSRKICSAAVKQNGLALKYSKFKDKNIIYEAVKQNGFALRYVDKQDEEVCLRAVKSQGLALDYVKDKKDFICLEAVRNNGLALMFVENQTEEICLAAINNDAYALEFVKNQTEDICKIAIEKRPNVLKFVENQTEDLCFIAINKDSSSFQFVQEQSLKMCEKIKKDPYIFDYIKSEFLKEAFSLLLSNKILTCA